MSKKPRNNVYFKDLEQRVKDLEAKLVLLCDKLGVEFKDETHSKK